MSHLAPAFPGSSPSRNLGIPVPAHDKVWGRLISDQRLPNTGYLKLVLSLSSQASFSIDCYDYACPFGEYRNPAFSTQGDWRHAAGNKDRNTIDPGLDFALSGDRCHHSASFWERIRWVSWGDCAKRREGLSRAGDIG